MAEIGSSVEKRSDRQEQLFQALEDSIVKVVHFSYEVIAEDVTNHGKIDLTIKIPDKIFK